MKAMIYSGKGSQQENLKIAATYLPKPKSNQVLVRIEAASLNIIGVPIARAGYTGRCNHLAVEFLDEGIEI